MRLHPRVLIVQRAGNELSEAVSQLIERHKLTFGEIFAILSAEMQQWAKYEIRSERHPNEPDKRGGEA